MISASADGPTGTFQSTMTEWPLAVCAIIFAGWLLLLPARAIELAVGDILFTTHLDRGLIHIDPVTGANTPLIGPDVHASSLLVEPAGTIIVGNAQLHGEWSAFIRIDPRDGSITH